MFRRHAENGVEVFLAHPGGPFCRNKDAGAWGIPKGEPLPEEALEGAAVREFEEETGLVARPPFSPLGSVRQKSGKTVHAWAFEGDVPDGYLLRCNLFEIEW